MKKYTAKIVGAFAAFRLKIAAAAGERGSEDVLQNVMERMYAEANHARAFQNGKVKAAEEAVRIADAQVLAQQATIKAAQRHLSNLFDVAATKQHELEATRVSAEAFVKLLPTPGVSK